MQTLPGSWDWEFYRWRRSFCRIWVKHLTAKKFHILYILVFSCHVVAAQCVLIAFYYSSLGKLQQKCDKHGMKWNMNVQSSRHQSKVGHWSKFGQFSKHRQVQSTSSTTGGAQPQRHCRGRESQAEHGSSWFLGHWGSYPIGCWCPMWLWWPSWVSQSQFKALAPRLAAHLTCGQCRDRSPVCQGKY